MLTVDPVGQRYMDKIVGRCPHCDEGRLRAHGGVESGVEITCTNHRCHAGWKSD